MLGPDMGGTTVMFETEPSKKTLKETMGLMKRLCHIFLLMPEVDHPEE